MNHERAIYILQNLAESTPEDSEENRLIKEALNQSIKMLTFTSNFAMYLKLKLQELKELTGEELKPGKSKSMFNK